MNKIISVILLLILAISTSMVAADNTYSDLTLQQKALLKKAHAYGEEFDLGYSMAAIMWQESFVGKKIVPFNIDDPSGGYWHKHIDYLLREENKRINSITRNFALLELIQNMDYAAAIAICDIEMWYVEFGEQGWLRVWAAYNGGYSNSKASQTYAQEVKEKINILINKKVFKPTEKEGEKELVKEFK